MQLPNPNQDKPFDRVVKDKEGKDEWGYRGEEVIHIPTSRSNMSYWKPEPVFSPTECNHEFVITNIGRREVECKKCTIPASFIVGTSLNEEKSEILFNDKWYSLLISSL